MHARLQLVSITVVLTAAIACSSKHRAIDLDAGADASTIDAGGPPPVQGTGGSSSITTTTPTTTPTAAPAVKCGSTTCDVPGQTLYGTLAGFAQLLGVALPTGGAGILPQACCTSANVCGLQANGSCVPRPKSDPRCPDVAVLGVSAPGCCLEAQGICGANGAQSGMGCIDVSNPLFSVLGAATPPACSAPDAGTTDAGTPDAGKPDAMMSMPDDGGQEPTEDAGK